eukprot:GHVS01103673.1.p1 GENE.GHVS01103673.1~~GHVS01103673.1.p1  ORF type:complete len:312 (+),score=27.51 GHVS01103673.1:30-938(+)
MAMPVEAVDYTQMSYEKRREIDKCRDAQIKEGSTVTVVGKHYPGFFNGWVPALPYLEDLEMRLKMVISREDMNYENDFDANKLGIEETWMQSTIKDFVSGAKNLSLNNVTTIDLQVSELDDVADCQVRFTAMLTDKDGNKHTSREATLDAIADSGGAANGTYAKLLFTIGNTSKEYLMTDGQKAYLDHLMRYAMKGQTATEMYYVDIQGAPLGFGVAVGVTTKAGGGKFLSAVGFRRNPIYVHREYMEIKGDMSQQHLRWILMRYNVFYNRPLEGFELIVEKSLRGEREVTTAMEFGFSGCP